MKQIIQGINNYILGGNVSLYAIASSMPPFLTKAVQSLSKTILGSDGKYYQEDIVGVRDDINFGGVGIFDGTRAVGFSSSVGTIANYEGTSTPTVNGNIINFTAGEISYMEFTNGSKYYFENFDDGYLYDVSDNGNHGTLFIGSAIGWQTRREGIFSYIDTYGGNKYGDNYIPALESDPTVDVNGNPNANQGRVKFNAEMHSSCISVDGTQQFNTSGFINMAEDEDFYYPFRFSLSGTVKDYESVFVIENSIYLFANRIAGGTKPNFLIKQNNNSLAVIIFPSNLPRDGSLITGFVRKIGDQATLCFNGVEETKTLALPSKAITNGILEIGGNGSNSSSLMTGEFYSLDISPHFKTDFSEFGGTTIYNLYENGNAELVAGSTTELWDRSPYAYPRNNTLGYSIGLSGEYIPASEIDPTKDVNGNDLQVLGTDTGLNGSETQLLQPLVYELLEVHNNFDKAIWYGTNLMDNGFGEEGFTSGVLTGWDNIRTNNPQAVQINGSPYMGQHNENIAGNTGVIGQDIILETGEDYTLTFWARNSKGSGGSIRDFTSGSFTTQLVVNTEWTMYEVDFTAGGNLGLGQYVNTNATAGTNGLDVGNITVKKTGDNTPILVSYDDITADYEDLHILFSDVVSKAPVKFNTTTYSEALAGDELLEAKEYFNIT